jgi:polysaccharide export outer membrane protein
VKRLRLLAALAVLVSCVSRSAPGDEYIIKPGDTLSITVLGEADLTKRFQVDAEGNITMPLVKQVHVADMTAKQATDEIATQLKRLMKNPQVSIDLVEPAKIQVTVSGEVRNPGILPLISGARLADAVAAAGGYTPLADLTKIAVSRSSVGQPTSCVDLSKFLLGGDTSANPAMNNGDTIFVPGKESIPIGTVTILGAVRQTGLQPIKQGMTLREVVTLAGGPTEFADPGSVTLRHEGAVETVMIDYSKCAAGDAASNPQLKPGDMVYFGSREQLGYYTIQGGVANPGRYELRTETSITEAIAVAGGIRGRVKLDKVSILRASDGGAQTVPVNVGQIMAGKSPNVPIRNADSIFVPAPVERPAMLQLAGLAISIAWLVFGRR